MARGRINVYNPQHKRIRNRLFKSRYERDLFTAEYRAKFPGCTVIALTMVEERKMRHPGNSKGDAETIINWFGAITGSVADKLCQKVFGCNAAQITRTQISDLWEKLDRPRKYKRDSILSFINS